MSNPLVRMVVGVLLVAAAATWWSTSSLIFVDLHRGTGGVVGTMAAIVAALVGVGLLASLRQGRDGDGR